MGDLHESSQAKLLRVLQEGEFQRVGGEQTVCVAVRVIAQAPCYRFELGSPEASAAMVDELCAGWGSRPLEAKA